MVVLRPPPESQNHPGRRGAVGNLRIGDTIVQPELGRLVVDGQGHRIEPKAMQVLLALANHPGTTRSRSELLAEVWPDTFVSEDVLNRAIYQLRKVLGDDPKQPQHIETVPKIGYRLLPSVEPVPVEPVPSVADPQRRALLYRPMLAAGAMLLVVTAVAFALRLSLEPADSPTRTAAHVVPLLAEPGQQTTPRLSPDGTRIAYTEDEGDDASGIRIRLVDGGAPLRLTSGFRDTAPVWSPDGSQLVWFRYRDDGSCELRRASYLGGDETRLTECPPGSEPPLAWSPDGRYLAFCAAQPGLLASRIWQLTIDSEPSTAGGLGPEIDPGRLTPLTQPPADFIGDGRPRFSKNGRWMAFVRGTVLGAADIHLLDLKSGMTRQITYDGLARKGLDFTPDDRHLVFLSRRGGDTGLWKVPVTGGAAQWVGFSRPALSQLTVAASGNRMAVTADRIESSIWQRSLTSAGDSSISAGNSAQRLIASSRFDRGAETSPDGERIAWVSDRSGTSEIWLASAAGDVLQPLTHFGGPQIGPPRWSPDSQRLLFEVRQQDSADLYVLEIDGRTLHRIPTPGSQELAPRWSANGEDILFASNRSGRWEVWRQRFAEGRARQLTTQGGFAAIEARDGSLFYTKMTHSGIWMQTADRSAEHQLIQDLPVSDWTNWALSDDGVLYLRRPAIGRGNAELLHIDTTTGRVERLAELGPIDARSSLTIAPTGDKILYGQNDRIDADIYLLDNLL
ncbi:MAG: winged helix-turn-helix domain-containing protein [Acidobacteriota bacterium]